MAGNSDTNDGGNDNDDDNDDYYDDADDDDEESIGMALWQLVKIGIVLGGTLTLGFLDLSV